MPSRKLADKCTKCGCKNHLRARFCNDCGTKLDDKRALGESRGEAREESRGKFKLYADTAHPINSKCRDEIEQKYLLHSKKKLKSLKNLAINHQ